MRHYLPGLGRFMSRVHLHEAVALGRTTYQELRDTWGVNIGPLGTPEAFAGSKTPEHAYVYAENNPVNRIDPSGLQSCSHVPSCEQHRAPCPTHGYTAAAMGTGPKGAGARASGGMGGSPDAPSRPGGTGKRRGGSGVAGRGGGGMAASIVDGGAGSSGGGSRAGEVAGEGGGGANGWVDAGGGCRYHPHLPVTGHGGGQWNCDCPSESGWMCSCPGPSLVHGPNASVSVGQGAVCSCARWHIFSRGCSCLISSQSAGSPKATHTYRGGCVEKRHGPPQPPKPANPCDLTPDFDCTACNGYLEEKCKNQLLKGKQLPCHDYAVLGEFYCSVTDVDDYRAWQHNILIWSWSRISISP